MSSRVDWFVIRMTLQTFRWQNFSRLWNRRVLVWAYGPWWDTFFRGLADKAWWICWKCLKLCCMFENQLYSACFEGPTFQLTERDLKSSDPSLKVSSQIWWLKDLYLPPTCTQDEKRGHVLNRLAFREITKCVCVCVQLWPIDVLSRFNLQPIFPSLTGSLMHPFGHFSIFLSFICFLSLSLGDCQRCLEAKELLHNNDTRKSPLYLFCG